MYPNSNTTKNEEFANSSLASSSPEWENISSTTCSSQIAPPPPKKRILLKSFEQRKETDQTVNMCSNLSDDPSASEPSRPMKPPRTYSRKRHIPN